jgi:diamine N-acetyltransferase
MPPSIQLRPITADNWEEVVALRLSPGQKHLFTPNWYALLQAIYEGGQTLAIYAQDTLVGFTRVHLVPEAGDAHIFSFMIDQDYQGFGYGRTALRELVALLRAQDGIHTLWLTVSPNNFSAVQLFESEGFLATGDMDFDEAVYVMRVTT